MEKIGLLKEKMTKYIEGLPQYWYPTFRLVCKDIEDSNRMKMALWMQHHMNYQVNFLHIILWSSVKAKESNNDTDYGMWHCGPVVALPTPDNFGCWIGSGKVSSD